MSLEDLNKKYRVDTKKLEETKSSETDSEKIVKLEFGETVIRLLPPEAKNGRAFREVRSHFNLDKKNGGFLCPRSNFKEACAACDYASDIYKELKKQEKETGKEDPDTRKLFKVVASTPRYFTRVLQRGKEKDGAKLFGCSFTLKEVIEDYLKNEEYGNIADLIEGTDLVIKKTREGGSFGTITATAKRKSSIVSEELTEEEILKALEEDLDPKDYLRRVTPLEVQEMMNNLLLDGEDVESVSKEEEKYKEVKKEEAKEKPKKEEVNEKEKAEKSLSDELDELTNS